ncbi:hypothetical protein GCM10011608_42670 [Micromonospora sonchi]|uniref:Lasso RiPP family leader peptide-containing protein n=1 Tax=Micromonospora sonchi TaxID=1763543 RepID=A0A917U2M0_9ACTN|nr:hypothetical protein [Micromonospora sonchi]GGM53264.1 hypothetical protein GCM10011608_42670 [Micromonospora sonchi]
MESRRSQRETGKADAKSGYQPPQLKRLGTLAELIKGGTIGVGDGGPSRSAPPVRKDCRRRFR